MSFEEVEPGLWLGSLSPEVGSLARLWCDHGARIIVAHPTFNNGPTVGAQLRGGIAAAAKNFGGRPVCFVVSDGTWTEASGDRSTLEMAEAAAREALTALPDDERALVRVILTPYEGHGGDSTPGKGSALKMLFDEMGQSPGAELLILHPFEAVRAVQKLLLVNPLQHQHHGSLIHLVFNCWDTNWSFLATGFRDVHPTHRRGLVTT